MANPPQGEPQKTASEKKPRGKPFTGKDDPRNRQNVEKSLSAELVDTLAAMRHVVAQPSSADKTHQHKSMREWREASPASFYGRLADLEKAETGGKGSAAPDSPLAWDGKGECPCCHRGPGVPIPPDPKGPDIDRLIDQCLADLDERMAAG